MATLVVPRSGGPFPVLIALPGRGEAAKPKSEGAWGWPRDYALQRALDRLHSPPLTPKDLENLYRPADLARVNGQLSTHPFRGLVIVCPTVDDDDPHGPAGGALAQFISQTLLPRVYQEAPCVQKPEATGIDGVSLGGAYAFRVGLADPKRYRTVGALQPAFRSGQEGAFVELVRAARARNSDLRLRLVTSEGDYFRKVITSVSSGLDRAGQAHELLTVPGPHDYVWNRGPGAIEMLIWHDRELARA